MGVNARKVIDTKWKTMLCYIEPIKHLCFKFHDMEKSKVNQAMPEKMSLVDKLLGTGEERVMFRFVNYFLRSTI